MINVLGVLFVSVITLLSRITQHSDSLQENIPELSPQQTCPSCHSHNVIKNGSIHNGKSKNQCKDCRRQFVDNPNNIVISLQIKQLIDKLLLERISLRGIARVTGVSWSWLQDYVNSIMAHTPRQIRISGKLTGRLTIECDEMWSFVDSQKNAVYIWLAIDRNSRKIVGCFVGNRTRKSARQLWASLPDISQQSAVAYTDFWQAYTTVIPVKRHRAVGKETGLTNRIERLNNTLRQRVSRLVRASLSFSKKLNNHIGAIWYFIHGYNAELD
ncbi:IS1 family transposase, partial [Chroococcidiopsis cubana]